MTFPKIPSLVKHILISWINLFDDEPIWTLLCVTVPSPENIPLIKFYNDPSEVKNIVEEIFLLSEKQIDILQAASVEYIINNNNWAETTNKILKI